MSPSGWFRKPRATSPMGTSGSTCTRHIPVNFHRARDFNAPQGTIALLERSS
jgi:hypothetical protein